MTDIARAYPITIKQGLLRKKKPRVEILELGGNVELFTCTKGPDGMYSIARTTKDKLSDLGSLPLEAFIVSIQTQLQSLPFIFGEVVHDEKGYAWDLDVVSSISITDCRCFLRSCVLGLISPELPVTSDILESWIVTSVTDRVKDEIRRAIREHKSFDTVRHNEVLPARWWERQLSLWLQDCGIAIQLARVAWNSTEAAKAEAARKRSEQLAAIAREQDATRSAELHEMNLKAKYERERLRIEADTALSKRQKEQELALLELKHKRELIEAETQIENAQWAARKAAKEYEVAIAGLDGNLNEIQQAPKRQEEIEQTHRKTLDLLTKATEVLEKLNALDILKSLAQEKERHQSIERLLSPEFGFTAEEVAVVGYKSSDGTLLGRIREKAHRDNGTMTIRKKDLRTRSIQAVRFTRGLTRDISTTQIQHLPVNSPLQFEFSTQRPGLLTLLNIGTSGAIYVHVPNAFVGARAAKAEAKGTYEVPGPQFLPWDKIECYREDGPRGWEHMALMISAEPLIEHGIVLRSTPRNPLVRLSEEEVDRLCQKLETIKPDSWTGAVLSFCVME